MGRDAVDGIAEPLWPLIANPSEVFDCVCELKPVDRPALCAGVPDVERLSEVVESFDLCRQVVPLGEGVAALGARGRLTTYPYYGLIYP